MSPFSSILYILFLFSFDFSIYKYTEWGQNLSPFSVSSDVSPEPICPLCPLNVLKCSPFFPLYRGKGGGGQNFEFVPFFVPFVPLTYESFRRFFHYIGRNARGHFVPFPALPHESFVPFLSPGRFEGTNEWVLPLSPLVLKEAQRYPSLSLSPCSERGATASTFVPLSLFQKRHQRIRLCSSFPDETLVPNRRSCLFPAAVLS